MVEFYSFEKTIPSLNIEIDVRVGDLELLQKLDNVVMEAIKEHYGLKE